MTSNTRIAIIGAGLSGLACAQVLVDAGLPVGIFEKSRAPGGRAATRHAAPWQFDHGAQYFTQRDSALAPHLARWRAEGVVAPWTPRLVARSADGWRTASTDEARWVGTPGMRALGDAMATSLTGAGPHVRVHYGVTVRTVVAAAGGWVLDVGDDARAGPFDVVLCTAPAPQTRALLAGHAVDFAPQLAAAELAPCIAVMLAFDAPLEVAWDAAFVNDDPILAWVARDASKPARAAHETWVVHASAAWSAAHVADEPASLVAPVIDAFAALTGARQPPVHAVAHRWRFAIPTTAPWPQACGFDAAMGIGVAGDWCNGGRVEGALRSGQRLARRVLAAVGNATA